MTNRFSPGDIVKIIKNDSEFSELDYIVHYKIYKVGNFSYLIKFFHPEYPGFQYNENYNVVSFYELDQTGEKVN